MSNPLQSKLAGLASGAFELGKSTAKGMYGLLTLDPTLTMQMGVSGLSAPLYYNRTFKAPLAGAPTPDRRLYKFQQNLATLSKQGSVGMHTLNMIFEKTASMEKTAAPGRVASLLGDTWPEVGKNMATGLGVMGLAGMTGSMAAGAYGEVRDAVKREMSYRSMFEEFPELKEVPREQVDKYWTVLTDFAPKLAVNPLVAGQFIHNMLNYGMRGVDVHSATQLLQAEQAANRGAGSAFDAMKTLGSKGMNLMDTDLTAAATGHFIP